ncbi:hypothetical protein BT63DRAFT_69495 [Microthyrium microscopicum]|uniref:Antigenic cell wall galactomanno protein n=1 Tax=Microthyrium microscopicum TaxID=703497 RepID=A0A6A6U1T4_9PEZI|nr:hypothetical protein BT63DRAFT_69495 [Microthyrium microscopicum]
MLFKNGLIVAVVAQAAIAAPLQQHTTTLMVPADMPTIQENVDKVLSGIDKIIGDIKAYSPEKKDLTALLADSAAILSALADGTTKIKASPALGVADVLSILTPVGSLDTKVADVASALKDKKADFEKGGQIKDVLDQLQKQYAATIPFSKAITGSLPLPSVLGIIADPIAKGITDKLAGAVTDFGGTVPA